MVDSISHLASALESARAITMEAAAVATSKLGESSYTHYSQGLNAEQLQLYLNSRNSREVKDAMKRIISIMASDDSSIDVESFFADVLKNITTDDPKIKRLVYIYLLRYAEKDPNLALLSVNSIQKLLNESDPELRCFAIKALSDIKITSLVPIVVHTLKKSVTDSSPLVRSEVAYSLLKLYRWEGQDEFSDTINELLTNLLADSEPCVISASICVANEIFTNGLDWLHGHFRYYLKIIKQLDSWAQSTLINLLVRYSKKYIERPIIRDSTSSNENNYILLGDAYNKIEFPSYEIEMNSDLSFFLTQIEQLKYSSNPVVVLSCCNAFYQLATPKQFRSSKFPEALFKSYSITSNEGVKISLLQAIVLYAAVDPALFLSHIKSFFLFAKDNERISVLKLQVLKNLVNETNVKSLMRELKYYINYGTSEQVIIGAVSTLEKCANISPELESYIMKWLINNMEHSHISNIVLDCYVNIIRKLIITNPMRHLKILIKLSEILEKNLNMADNARAGLIWLFGEMTSIEIRICPDVLRKLLLNFVNEGPETRNAILLFAAKLLSCEVDQHTERDSPFDWDNSRIAKMYEYIINLAKFDDDFDIRDRTRWISSVFDSKRYEIATLLFQAPKPSIRNTTNGDSYHFYDDDEYIGIIDNDMKKHFEYISWNDEFENTEDKDIREPAVLKDYSRFRKNLSSKSFISGNNISRTFQPERNFETNHNIKNDSDMRKTSPSNTFSSGTGRKYKLQSLDEFFSDIPVTTTDVKSKKFINVKKDDDSSSEDETTSDDDDVDSETESESDSESDESESDEIA